MITGDPGLLESVRQDLKALGGAARIDLVASVEEACDLLDKVQPRLIIADWKRRQNGFDAMDRLLWATSKLVRHTPVVVIADRYREDQAVMFYRMGVSDYISRSDHLSSLTQILSAYLTPSSSSSSGEFQVISTPDKSSSSPSKKNRPAKSPTPPPPSFQALKARA
jgi:DNA-binding NarL/FixJ family response regulator